MTQDDDRTPQTPEQEQARKFTKADAKLLAFGIIALLAGIFIGQNTREVKVSFVFATAHIRLIWVFLLCIVIGALLDRLLVYRGVLPQARRRRRKHSHDDQ